MPVPDVINTLFEKSPPKQDTSLNAVQDSEVSDEHEQTSPAANSTPQLNGIHQPQDTTDSSKESTPRSSSEQQRSSKAPVQPAEQQPDTSYHASPSSEPATKVITTSKEVSSPTDKAQHKPENGSASKPINGNPHTQTSPRGASQSSSPSGAPPAAASASKKATKSQGRKHKSSFLRKLVRKLVPCVAAGAHPVELDECVPNAVISTSQGEKLKQEDATPTALEPPVAPPKDTTLETTKPGVQPSTSTMSSPPVSITPPPTIPDMDIIVPPTPTQLLPEEETEGVTSGAVQPPGSTGGSSIMLEHRDKRRDSTVATNGAGDGDESDGTSFTEDEDLEEGQQEDIQDEEDRLILNGGAGIPIGPDGVPKPLLPPIAPQHAGRKCLVLDLDETLVHSSFKSIQQADYVVPVEIEFHWHNVYVIKRPGVDNFLKKMGEIYEIVVFTASLSKYADPVLDKLDVHQVVSHRLFRESCYNHRGNYVKDLSQLGRPIADTIILDNSPASYIFHPNNAVPVSSWFNDPHDSELTDLVPFLTDLSMVDDVRGVLDGAR